MQIQISSRSRAATDADRDTDTGANADADANAYTRLAGNQCANSGLPEREPTHLQHPLHIEKS